MWPAEFPSIQPGQGQPSPPSLHHTPPSPNHRNLLCMVLFLDTFRCTPRKRRMSSSLQGKKFQTCGSARCFFQVLGGFFPPSPLRIGMNSSMCSQPPTTSAVCHSGLSLPDRVLCQDGISSIFPTSSRKERFCLH